MADHRPVLLLTRPEPASRRFAAQVTERFAELPVIIAPSMRIVPTVAMLPEAPPAGLIFTSENAVEAFCKLSPRRDLPAWCVGPATLAACKRAGITARLGPGDAAGLTQMILDAAPKGTLWWPRGAEVAQDLAALLRPHRIEVQAFTVYEAQPLAPTAEVQAALQKPDPLVLALFSPRSVAFAGWVAQRAGPLWVLAISDAVARAAAPLGPERLKTAETPDAEGMLTALAAFGPFQRRLEAGAPGR